MLKSQFVTLVAMSHRVLPPWMAKFRYADSLTGSVKYSMRTSKFWNVKKRKNTFGPPLVMMSELSIHSDHCCLSPAISLYCNSAPQVSHDHFLWWDLDTFTRRKTRIWSYMYILFLFHCAFSWQQCNETCVCWVSNRWGPVGTSISLIWNKWDIRTPRMVLHAGACIGYTLCPRGLESSLHQYSSNKQH